MGRPAVHVTLEKRSSARLSSVYRGDEEIATFPGTAKDPDGSIRADMFIKAAGETLLKRSERGWSAHYILAERCLFRRNTLLELAEVRIVVSTVGRQLAAPGLIEPLGPDRFFETMAFHAWKNGKFWDADIARQLRLDSPFNLDSEDVEDQADAMHEAIVAEISSKMLSGKPL